jgi:hypothetical protein
MVKPEEGAAPAVRHVAEVEWWVLRLAGTGGQGKQPLELVVVGKAAE